VLKILKNAIDFIVRKLTFGGLSVYMCVCIFVYALKDSCLNFGILCNNYLLPSESTKFNFNYMSFCLI
jgi:hypothetical protein